MLFRSFNSEEDTYTDGIETLFLDRLQVNQYKPLWILDRFINISGACLSKWRYGYIYNLSKLSFSVHYFGWDRKWDINMNINSKYTIKRICFNTDIIFPNSQDRIMFDIVNYKTTKKNKSLTKNYEDNLLSDNQLRTSLLIRDLTYS